MNVELMNEEMGNDKKYVFIYFLVMFIGEFWDVFVCMVFCIY